MEDVRQSKNVHFNLDSNVTYQTWSSDEYDRTSIDFVLLRRVHNKIDHNQWINIFVSLNDYKCNSMVVHKRSISNLRLH
jgi:hypothetical protein